MSNSPVVPISNELNFANVEFCFDHDGDLEISLVATTKHERDLGYMGRYLRTEQIEQLRQWLNSHAPGMNASNVCLDCDGKKIYPSGEQCKSCGGSGRVLPEDGVQLPSKEIDVIRAWIQTQWERVPVTPQSQPGSYARGYDGGMMDILRGLQKTLDKLPPAHETREGCKPTVESAAHRSAGPGCRCADCSIDGEACPTCYAAWWRDRHPTVHEHAQKASEPSPNDALCWICPRCTTVNGIEDEVCVCRGRRPSQGKGE